MGAANSPVFCASWPRLCRSHANFHTRFFWFSGRVQVQVQQVNRRLSPAAVWICVAFIGSQPYFLTSDPLAYNEAPSSMQLPQIQWVASVFSAISLKDWGACNVRKICNSPASIAAENRIGKTGRQRCENTVYPVYFQNKIKYIFLTALFYFEMRTWQIHFTKKTSRKLIKP